MAHDLGIDWQQPWLEPWRDIGQAVQGRIESGTLLHEALNQSRQEWGAQGRVRRFVAAQARPSTEAYESYIFRSGNCPVAPGLHDFFNGLCWLRFPQSKARLNALQAQAIAQCGVQSERGPLRDALTLFDENAALLQAPTELWQALQARNWSMLFLELRPLWAQARLVLFGHALLEKLMQPRKSITAHVYRITDRHDGVATLDHWLATDLDPLRMATKPFLPLPVLGVPGWCLENEDPIFYADSQVFRKPRDSRRQHVPKSGGD